MVAAGQKVDNQQIKKTERLHEWKAYGCKNKVATLVTDYYYNYIYYILYYIISLCQKYLFVHFLLFYYSHFNS